jgi:hypothetical protein
MKDIRIEDLQDYQHTQQIAFAKCTHGYKRMNAVMQVINGRISARFDIVEPLEVGVKTYTTDSLETAIMRFSSIF